jgi:chaperone modulatory protein CbpM
MVRMTQVIEARLLGEGDWIAATEICQLCRLDLEALLELAALGLAAPRESGGGWQVPASALPRLRVAGRLMRDLGLNAAGAALALELLEAQRELERRIRHLERLASADY